MNQVLELDARYLLADDEQSATLLLSCDLYDLETDEQGQPCIFLTTIHEKFSGGFGSYDHRGRFALQLEVKRGESLTLIARREGRICASLVNEIETSTASRVLLKPKGGFHLIIHQSRCFEPEQVQVRGLLETRVLTEIAPSATLLKQMVSAIEQHYAATPYPLPETFRLLWPTIKMPGIESDERYCTEMLICLCAAVEAAGIHRTPDMAPVFDQAAARIGIPV